MSAAKKKKTTTSVTQKSSPKKSASKAKAGGKTPSPKKQSASSAAVTAPKAKKATKATVKGSGTKKASSKKTAPQNTKKTTAQTKVSTKKATAEKPPKKVAAKKLRKATAKTESKNPKLSAAEKLELKQKSVIKRKNPEDIPKKKKRTMKVVKSHRDTFEIGERAVYPAYGVGEIIRIDQKEIAGALVSFYVMQILDSEMTVMVPVAGVTNVGLRRLINPAQVNQVYEVFKDNKVVIDTTTWNRRQREYNEKIKTGSVFEIAEVMRDLYVLKEGKTLSFGERSMLDKARNLLVKELAISKDTPEEEVEQKIQKCFDKK